MPGRTDPTAGRTTLHSPPSARLWLKNAEPTGQFVEPRQADLGSNVWISLQTLPHNGTRPPAASPSGRGLHETPIGDDLPPTADGLLEADPFRVSASLMLTVSLALWMARSGVLAASLLLSAPAWRSYDLLPVLRHRPGDRVADPDGDGDDDNGGDESHDGSERNETALSDLVNERSNALQADLDATTDRAGRPETDDGALERISIAQANTRSGHNPGGM